MLKRFSKGEIVAVFVASAILFLLLLPVLSAARSASKRIEEAQGANLRSAIESAQFFIERAEDSVTKLSPSEQQRLLKAVMPTLIKQAKNNPNLMGASLEELVDLVIRNDVTSAIHLDKYANQKISEEVKTVRTEAQTFTDKLQQKDREIQSLKTKISELGVEKDKLKTALDAKTGKKGFPVYFKYTWKMARAFIKVYPENNKNQVWTVVLGDPIPSQPGYHCSGKTIEMPPGVYIVEFYENDQNNFYKKEKLIVTDFPSVDDKYHGYVITPN